LFSYGSNSLDQVKERINREGNIVCHPAYLDNFIRIFAGQSAKWNDGGVATIYPVKGQKCYGLALEVTEDELLLMDEFENGYYRSIQKVRMENGKSIRVNIYIKKKNEFLYFPSEKYLEAINKMLNDRSSDKDRKIMIRGLVNGKIVGFGSWSKKDGFSIMKK